MYKFRNLPNLTKAKYSYYDRVDYNALNTSFFIYNLGRINNKAVYYYGLTDDILNIEYKLKKTVPLYNNITNIPVENNIYNFDKFDKYIQNKKCDSPYENLCNEDECNVFNIDDNSELQTILNVTRALFKIQDD